MGKLKCPAEAGNVALCPGTEDALQRRELRCSPRSGALASPATLTRGDGRVPAAPASARSQGPSSDTKGRVLSPKGPTARLHPLLSTPCTAPRATRSPGTVTPTTSSELPQEGMGTGERKPHPMQTHRQSSLTSHPAQ